MLEMLACITLWCSARKLNQRLRFICLLVRYRLFYISVKVVVSLGLFTILLLGAGLCFPWAVETLFATLSTIKRTEVFKFVLLF